MNERYKKRGFSRIDRGEETRLRTYMAITTDEFLRKMKGNEV